MLLGSFFGLLVVAPFVLAYFLIIKATDRYEPEPWWLLGVMFGWGAVVATLTAIVGNEIGGATVRWALSAQASDALVQASTASFVAPLVEETTKGVGLLLLFMLSSLWLKELDGPLDGAIYGGVVGLGFTLTEDVLYIGSAAASGGVAGFATVFVLRTVLAGLSHATFTAMTGLGLGIAADTRSTALKLVAPFVGWCAAVLLHFVHNFLVTFLMNDGAGLVVKYLFFWTVDAGFFCLIVALGLRDRRIVSDGLRDELGGLVHPFEYERTTSHWMLVPGWNLLGLLGSPSGYGKSRKKQLDLIKLAFLKRRRQRGDRSAETAMRERELRARIQAAAAAGVFVGAPEPPRLHA